MKIQVIKDEKDVLIVELENPTMAELLRIYLNKDDAVSLAAWKRENPDKPVVFEIRTKGKTAKKALQEAAEAIEKSTSKLVEEFKKLVK